MINLTKLYTGLAQPADALRYGQGHGASSSAGQRKPVVVWNITRRCNLHCQHCYSDSESRIYPGELSFEQCCSVIDDLADLGVPAVLLSGGEPILHSMFFDLASRARDRSLRLTLSTNGTFIDHEMARRLKHLGFAYVGISLDGIGETHDRFRGRKGAFDKAVAAFRNCRTVGQKAGLRLTLSRNTVRDLPEILDFIESENIPRVCFYHLVHSGRGFGLQLLEPEAARAAIDMILDRTRLWAESGISREVLTVDQPADGAYLLMRLLRENPDRAREAFRLLRWNGGGANSSGVGVANIDPQGNVHPDQFWQTHTIGNVKDRPFSEIWTRSGDELMLGLRDRLPRLTGRCGHCSFKRICGGGFRVRAQQAFGDPWTSDPGCYLSDSEIEHGFRDSFVELPA